MDTGKIIYHRNCPKCNRGLNYAWKASFVKAEENNQTCYKCRPNHWLGKTHTDETRLKISKANKGNPRCAWATGKSQSKEWIESRVSKIRGKNNGMYGKHHTDEWKLLHSLRMKKENPMHNEETRTKSRVGVIRYLKTISRNGQFNPNYNKIACKLFEEINKELNWNGQHAENGGEYHIPSLGYWVDYYEPNHNIVIEYDEKSVHSRNKNKIRDSIREKQITDYLGCRFIRIPESEAFDWKKLI